MSRDDTGGAPHRPWRTWLRLPALSRALVSLVMRDSPRVSVESRRRVTDAAAKLGYRPNLMARNLAARKTMTIGVLLNDLHNPWFAEVTDGIHDVAERHGYQLILASGRRSTATRVTCARHVPGLTGRRHHRRRLSACRRPGSTPSPARSRSSRSGGHCRGRASARSTTDDAYGARLAVEHLYELGHRRIAHIDGGKRCRRGTASQWVPAHHARPRPERQGAGGRRRLHRGGRSPRCRATAARPGAADRDLHRQRPLRGRSDRRDRTRRPGRPRRRRGRRLRQHLAGRA